MTWDAEAKEMKSKGMGDTAIADSDVMRAAFPDMNDRQRREKVRGLFRDRKKEKQAGAVGVIGDLHAPFAHENYLQFCIDTFKEHGCTSYVFIGDLVDHHTISRFQSETCADSSLSEMKKAREQLDAYIKAFPRAKWCVGNHDLRIERQAASLGIDKAFLKPLHDVYGIPKTWEIAEEFIINDVLYKHGTNCGGGKFPALDTAIREGLSSVIGHYHSRAGCVPIANKRRLIYGLSVGCGIDVSAYAFIYGKESKERPLLGCGIVYSRTHAMFIPMGARYFRD